MSNFFVTAIGTDSGKTLISAILTEALQADYWKAVQAGTDETDKQSVKDLISNTTSYFHDEAYLLQSPESPHSSAKKEGIEVELDKINIPTSNNEHLIIEGAGGIMVPLNDKEHIADLAEKLKCDIILVSNLYLGSINHTLLTINELKRRQLPVKGIIFNGEENREAQKHILAYSGYKELLHVPKLEKVDKEAVLHYAKLIKKHF